MNSQLRQAFANNMARTIHNSNSLIFVSQTTQRKFEELFPQTAKNLHLMILHPSVDDDIAAGTDNDSEWPRFSPSIGCVATSERHRAPAKSAESELYFVIIMSDEERKNIANAVAAFSMLPAHIRLKVIGHVDAKRYRAQSQERPLHASEGDETSRAEQIEWLGYVSETRKHGILAAAAGVIMPSFSEGFGIPVVEACFFGKPVFCSDIPVFREVVGDRAFYFNPRSPKSIAEAINVYLSDRQKFVDQTAQAEEECRRRFSLSAQTREVARYFGNANQSAES
jgi:glycosyltransferase involved in cell wall biosynthesis